MEGLYEVAERRPRGRPSTLAGPLGAYARGLAWGLIAAGKSRKEAARALGVHRSTLWRWIRGDRP